MIRPAGLLLGGAVLLSALAGPARAQDWRTLESSRQLKGDESVGVHVQYVAGIADVAPMGGAWLYRMRLRYDADRTAPIASYDATLHELRLGTRSSGAGAWKGSSDGNELHAELSDRVPMQLTLELGATRADIELGGLRLRALELRAGAAQANVDVRSPNPESLRDASFDVGAAHVTVDHGGNLRASKVTINVGAGALDYDLDGEWSGDVHLDASVAMGGLTLRVPPDAGIRVSAKTFLVDFSRAGLVQRGDDWESPGYDSATRHVHVQARAAFGSFEIIRR